MRTLFTLHREFRCYLAPHSLSALFGVFGVLVRFLIVSCFFGFGVVPLLAQDALKHDFFTSSVGAGAAQDGGLEGRSQHYALAYAIKDAFQDLAQSASRSDSSYYKALDAFYAEKSHQILWTTQRSYSSRGKILIAALEGADFDGLDAKNYVIYTTNAPPFDTLYAQARADILLSVGILKYLDHLMNGQVSPKSVSNSIDPTKPRFDGLDVLLTLTESPALENVLEFYKPQSFQYKRLEKYLAKLLKATPQVQAKQNARAHEIHTVRVAMEQWRWLPRELGQRYVLVNIPTFMLDIYEGETSVYQSRVVVGDKKHHTNVFSDMMEFVVVNPTWSVPRSIAQKEMLPKLQRDPLSLQRQRIDVVSLDGIAIDPLSVDWAAYSENNLPFSFKQASGRGNALGHIKFLFPNKHAIYLHDTPQRKHFDFAMRAYSHGCIRLHNPFEFADALLKGDEKLSSSTLKKSIGDQERWFKLQHHTPVHLGYITAEVNASGKLVEYQDVYGYSARLAQKMGI